MTYITVEEMSNHIRARGVDPHYARPVPWHQRRRGPVRWHRH